MTPRKKSTFLFVGIGLAFVAVIIFQYYDRNDLSDYERRISQQRADKDLQFREAGDSPIPDSVRNGFSGLRYFPANPLYRVEAELLSPQRTDTLTLMMSSGEDYQVARVGRLAFELLGVKHQLTTYAYLEPGVDKLFVPFYDLTSGNETYGGGRYLELPAKSGTLTLDFNTAYNPYCVYDATYVCPLPPPENRLAVEVRAGELMYP